MRAIAGGYKTRARMARACTLVLVVVLLALLELALRRRGGEGKPRPSPRTRRHPTQFNDVGNIVNAGIGGFPNAIYRDWWAPLWPTSCFVVGNYGPCRSRSASVFTAPSEARPRQGVARDSRQTHAESDLSRLFFKPRRVNIQRRPSLAAPGMDDDGLQYIWIRLRWGGAQQVDRSLGLRPPSDEQTGEGYARVCEGVSLRKNFFSRDASRAPLTSRSRPSSQERLEHLLRTVDAPDIAEAPVFPRTRASRRANCSRRRTTGSSENRLRSCSSPTNTLQAARKEFRRHAVQWGVVVRMQSMRKKGRKSPIYHTHVRLLKCNQDRYCRWAAERVAAEAKPAVEVKREREEATVGRADAKRVNASEP